MVGGETRATRAPRFSDTALLLAELDGRVRLSLEDEAKLRAAVLVHGLQGGVTARQAARLLGAWERLMGGGGVNSVVSTTARSAPTEEALAKLRVHAGRILLHREALVGPPTPPAEMFRDREISLARLSADLHVLIGSLGYLCGPSPLSGERVCYLLGSCEAMREDALKLGSPRWRKWTLSNRGADGGEITLHALGGGFQEGLHAKLTQVFPDLSLSLEAADHRGSSGGKAT